MMHKKVVNQYVYDEAGRLTVAFIIIWPEVLLLQIHPMLREHIILNCVNLCGIEINRGEIYNINGEKIL